MSQTADAPEFDRGTPGASARREGERRRAARESRARERHPWIWRLLLGLNRLPQTQVAWTRGAEGEEIAARRLAARLDPSVELLFDRGTLGGKTNIDMIAVAASGVWVIDVKRYSGRVDIRRPLFGAAKLTIAGADQTKLVTGLAKQVGPVEAVLATSAPGVPVRGAFCFVDSDLPRLRPLEFDGYALAYPRSLAKRVNSSGSVALDRLRAIAMELAERFPPA